MKLSLLCLALLLAGATFVPAQDPALEEKINKLRADLDDLQFRLKKTEDEIAAIRKELRELAPAATAEQIQALEARIAAVDKARERDRQAIIEQVAKELAGVGTGTKPVAPAAGKEHVVKQGETLTSIARQYGLSVAELKRLNNLTGDNPVLAIGQKLVTGK